MLADVAIWGELIESVGWKESTLTDLGRHQLIRRLVGILVSDVIEATSERIKKSKASSALDLQKLDHNVIGYSEAMEKKNREIKDFLYSKLYRHHRVVRMAHKAEHVLNSLFKAYEKEADMLPEEFKSFVVERGLHRTICDYLAGMTDRYAIQEYERLFDPRSRP
jgi:dGTPase